MQQHSLRFLVTAMSQFFSARDNQDFFSSYLEFESTLTWIDMSALHTLVIGKKKEKIFIKHFIQGIVVMPLHTSPAFDAVHFNTAPSLVELCLSVFADVKHLFLVHANPNCVGFTSCQKKINWVSVLLVSVMPIR